MQALTLLAIWQQEVAHIAPALTSLPEVKRIHTTERRAISLSEKLVIT
jgi:hypothetical protein